MTKDITNKNITNIKITNDITYKYKNKLTYHRPDPASLGRVEDVCHSNLLQIKFIFGGTSEKFGEKMFLNICYKVLSEKQMFLKPLKE